MRTIDDNCSNTYIINKSKFLSFAYPVSTVTEIESILLGLQDKFSDATHICYAYILSSPRMEKYSDDGEPTGTAGKPILELLKKKNLDNVFVAVIRYFGGIKLGAGGLIRAYTTSAKEVIDKSKVIDAVLGFRCEIVIDIQNANKLKMTLTSLNVHDLKIEYGEKVRMVFVIDDVDKIKDLKPNILEREMYVGN